MTQKWQGNGEMKEMDVGANPTVFTHVVRRTGPELFGVELPVGKLSVELGRTGIPWRR